MNTTMVTIGMSSGQIALIGASIGASAAILGQLITFLLTRSKERKKLKVELVAEERRIASLLTDYYKILVMHKVHKQYWYRTSEIRKSDLDDSKDSHSKHFVSNEKSFETMEKILVLRSEYIKTVTHFTSLTEKKIAITKTLNEIKTFQPRKASEFTEVKDYDQLLISQQAEEEELNKVYLYYSVCFDRINAEITKKSIL